MEEHVISAYVDTCIVSGVIRDQLNNTELQALDELLERVANGELRFVTSKVTYEELNAMPEKHQPRHKIFYRLFEKVYKLPEPSITRLGLTGLPTGNPNRIIWDKLNEILPGENDANHAFQSLTNRIDYFVTVDRKSILKHKIRLLREVSLSACLPSELLKELNDNSIST